jgi:putative transposase
MSEWCNKSGVDIWSYCLMPNHVHLIAVPDSQAGLRRAIGEAHRRYTRRVNFRAGWRGHLWQGRFASFVMDKPHLLACARYVELNPVRAGLCRSAGDYLWSSAAAHLGRRDDTLVRVQPLLDLAPDWSAHLSEDVSEETIRAFRQHESTGRPIGEEGFVAKLEELVGRILRPRNPGPPAKTSSS